MVIVDRFRDMNKYLADLHIHTALSPCAEPEMSPANIVKQAKKCGLSIIGITDHNSTLNAGLTKIIGERNGIFVLTGAEVTTKEEVHCLVFFEKDTELSAFQEFIEENISRIPNNEGYFGYQPVVDENDQIIQLLDYFLPASLKKSIDQIRKKVDELNGIFIPAHIDRPVNSILSQLGFVPKGLNIDAMSISANSSEKDVRKHHVINHEMAFTHDSDAHCLDQIGEICSEFYLHEINFREIKMALKKEAGRYCIAR